MSTSLWPELSPATPAVFLLSLLFLGSLAAQGRNLAGLATASDRYPLLVGVDRPGKLLAEIRQALEGYRDDPQQVALMAELDAELRREFELSVFDAMAFPRTGIDFRRPMRFGIYDFSGWLGLPQAIMTEWAVADAQAFLAWFGRRLPDSELIEESRPPIRVAAKSDGAWTVIGKTCTAIFSGGKQTAAEGLDAALAAKGRTMTVGAKPGFRTGSKFFAEDRSAHTALYLHGVDPLTGREILREMPFESLLIAVGRRAAFLSVVPRKESAVLGLVRAGSSCDKFLARLPKPLASLSLSVTDPVALLRAVVEEWFGSEVEDLNEGVAMMTQTLGLSEASLQAQLKNGSLAFLAYPGEWPREPQFLLVCHLNDAESLRAKVKKLVSELMPTAKFLADEASVLVVSHHDEDLCILLVDDYLVVGTAEREALALAGLKLAGETGATTPKKDLWTPEVGQGGILEVDVGIADLFLLAGERVSPRVKAALMAAGRYHGVLKALDDCLVAEFAFRQEAGRAGTGRSQLGEWAYLWLLSMAESRGDRVLKRQRSACEESLSVLSQRASEDWQQTSVLPALPLEELPLLDPWGTKFRLEIGPAKDRVMASSAGTDGRFGTADDLKSK